jgi:hypothetical protein
VTFFLAEGLFDLLALFRAGVALGLGPPRREDKARR